MQPGTPAQSRRRYFWQKLGGDGLLISVGFHVLLAIIAVTLVITTLTPASPTKSPDTFGTGAGGGNDGQTPKLTEHRISPKNARDMVRSQVRLTAKSASGITLPDMPSMSIAALQSGAGPLGDSSKGLGGGGGGGIGPGLGIGRGGSNFVSPFGMRGKSANMLEGTLYDLKTDKNRKHLYPAGDQRARIREMHTALTGFIRNGRSKSFLDGKYASAPEKLYASNILIPPMNAGVATRSFECEKHIQAPGWLAYYEGYITPPETDSYRFVGMGDDGMLIVCQDEVKFWGPWTQGGMQTWVKARKDWAPAGAYLSRGSLPNLATNGRYYGSWFEMRKGSRYKVQILFAEAYGGLFSASILIQQKSKLATDNPPMNVPLPVFKLEPLSPEEMKLKKGMRMAWLPDGPSFGCEINKVAQPRIIGGR
jgi:hypothetical protein